VHCVVPGGGLSPDGTRWIAGRPNFFLAVRPLAKLFRRLFLERLQKAYDAGALNFFGDLVDLANPASFGALVADMRGIDWVVHAKKPFGGPAQALAYLGRYTHRVAIANSRLAAIEDDHVAFAWKDYRQNGACKDHEARARRVHPSLSLAHPARRLPPHPPLRLHGQWLSRRKARPVSVRSSRTDQVRRDRD
jgi:hypothetical protein